MGSAIGARIGEDMVQPEVGDALEMPKVACNQLEAVIEGRGCDLQVGIRKDVPASLEVGSNLTEDTGRREIEGQDGDSGQDPLLDVGQMPLAG